VLTPRSHYAQALLDLARLGPAAGSEGLISQEVAVRRLEEDDGPRLVAVFAASFSDLPPFTITDADVRLRAAEVCLGGTRAARNGEGLATAEVESIRIPHLSWNLREPARAAERACGRDPRAIAEALRHQEHDQLASTMLVGNCRSILWHWRCGFRPLGVL
jgi:hypothetical protein